MLILKLLRNVKLPSPTIKVVDAIVVLAVGVALSGALLYAQRGLRLFGFDDTFIFVAQLASWVIWMIVLLTLFLLFWKGVVWAIRFVFSLLTFTEEPIDNRSPELAEVVTEAQLVTESLKRLAKANIITTDSIQDAREKVRTLVKLVLIVSRKAAQSQREVQSLLGVSEALQANNYDQVRQRALGLDDTTIRQLFMYTGDEPAYWRNAANALGSYAILLGRFYEGLEDLRSQLVSEVNASRDYLAKLDVVNLELQAQPALIAISSDLYQVAETIRDFKRIAPMPGISTEYAAQLPKGSIYFLESEVHD